MDGQWLTYRDIAVRLGVSVEAARRRALRGKWARMPGNDGMTRVRPPDDLSDHRTPDVRPDAVPNNPVHELQAQITRLAGELAGKSEALIEARARAEAAEARAEKQAADFTARDAERSADLAAERARADKAIGAFATLADRLEALAAANQRQPFLKRLKQRLVG